MPQRWKAIAVAVPSAIIGIAILLIPAPAVLVLVGILLAGMAIFAYDRITSLRERPLRAAAFSPSRLGAWIQNEPAWLFYIALVAVAAFIKFF